jgi:uncharacterized protein YggE
MRRFLFVFFLSIFFVPQAMATECEKDCVPPVRRTISVSGDAEVRVIPDQVLISLTAETRGKTLDDVKKENDKTVSSLIAHVTEKLGVEKKNVQTDRMNVAPVYRECGYRDELEGKCNRLDIVYYMVRKGVQIRLDDPELYDAIVTAALHYGVSHVDDVQFITTELRKHRDEARELAAKASLEKAEAIAKTLGMKVGKPISVNVNQVSHYYPWIGRGRGGHSMMQNTIQSAMPSSSIGESPDGGLSLGQISVFATINATYEME